MFDVDRVFYTSNAESGRVEWYFQAREGNSGPYQSKKEAQLMLQEFIKERIADGDTGGRDPKEAQSTQSTLKSGAQATFKFIPRDVWY
jgi:hypothetical protein